MIPHSLSSIIGRAITVGNDSVVIMNEALVREKIIDELIYKAVFGATTEKPAARWLIWEIAQAMGIYPSSIQPLYAARGRNLLPNNFSVPAMNFRGMAYDTSRALFKTAKETKTKAFICELARGEMNYTGQSPAEYIAAMLSGAIKEGYEGPVFIQGDHFQTKCSKTAGVPDEGEIEALVQLIRQAVDAGFYNIDIDTSTLVDLAEAEVEEQQRPNFHYTAELIQVIRALEPAGMTISVGGEIGHIGGKNSTVADFTCFMEGLKQKLPDEALISKISVATGTSHGGVVKPDGSMAPVTVDFRVLKEITAIAVRDYHIAGAVQHGASTLPDTELHRFPETEAVEVHLATGFQNYVMDDEAFPRQLLEEMYQWLDKTKQAEKEKGWTDEQFHYKLRKKCWGQFKQKTWDLPAENRKALRTLLAQRFNLIFEQLNVKNTDEMVDEHMPHTPIHKEVVDFVEDDEQHEVMGLSD